MSDLAPIIDRLTALLGPIDGEPQPLDGGITNCNYRVLLGGADYVVRVPGRDTELLGIDRPAEARASAMAARVGVGPEVGAVIDDPSCLVTGFIEGSAVSPEQLGEPATLALTAAAIRSVHECGEELP